MPIILSETEQKQLRQIEKGNRYLFLIGTAMLLFMVGIWGLVVMNHQSVGQLAESMWPNANPTLEKLARIVPQTSTEAYLLAQLKKIIPLGPVMVKIMAVSSILSWLFCVGLLAIGFSSRQKKMIGFFKGLISKP